MAQREETVKGKALERAAKYICTLKCGLCPMVVEGFPCPRRRCTLNTKPWQCWLAFFAASSAQGS